MKLKKIAAIVTCMTMALAGCGQGQNAGDQTKTTDNGAGTERTVTESEQAKAEKGSSADSQTEAEKNTTSDNMNEDAASSADEQSQPEADETVTNAADMNEEGEVMIPEIDIKQRDIPDNEALRFASNLKCGWNLGNTFDATREGGLASNEMEIETAWVGVKTTKEMIQEIHKGGFETIRIPVSWHNHVSGDDYQISEQWLARVQEVVDYAIDDGMYVIINIHHDEQEFFPSSDHMDESMAYVKSVWTQLCDTFGDYDEHLIFENLNEPRLVGSPNEWNLAESDPACQDAAECINEMNKAFVDLVRESGRGNATRYLMVSGYVASPDGACSSLFKLPEDPAGHLMVSVHAYTPYTFALMPQNESGAKDSFSVKNHGDTADIESISTRLYTTFIKKGIPVVIGEYGSVDRNGNIQSRVDHAAFFVAKFKSCGIPCVWWDNNIATGDGERFQIFDRRSMSWTYPEILAAIMQYAD